MNKVGTPMLTEAVAGPFVIHKSDKRHSPWVSKPRSGFTLFDALNTVKFDNKPMAVDEAAWRLTGRRYR